MNDNNDQKKFIPAPLSDRFIAYIFDLVIILSISSILAGAAGAGPVIYKISTYYLYGHHAILKYITSKDGQIFLLFYYILSVSYFFFESYFGLTLGKFVLKIKTAVVHNKEIFFICLVRGFLKANPPLVLIDGVFAFKRRLKQRLSDKCMGFVVVRDKNSKLGPFNVFVTSIGLYYLPLLAMTVFVYLYHFGALVPPPEPNTGTKITPSPEQWKYIFTNNFSISYTYYIVGGGFTLLFMTLLQLFSGSLLTGKALGDALIANPSFIIFGVFPHFFFETFGYVSGIMCGIEISKLIIGIVEGYFEKRTVKDLINMMTERGKYIIIFAIISIVLLLFAAWVETYVTSYILNHYYF